MVVTFEQMTIKQLMYMQKVPFLCTGRACVFFLVLGFALEEKLHGAKCCKFYRPEGVPILYSPTRTITPTDPSHCNAESSSQQPTMEARPYEELQVPT